MNILVIILLLLALLFGAPLFVVLGAAALFSFKYLAELSPAIIVQEMYKLASAPVLLALPLFTFAGYILAESNAPRRLVNVSNAFIGWLPGGLGIVSIISASIFTALTGASGVTIIALGGLLLPALLEARYPEDFSLGLVTCSGSLGILFPPSLPIIIYGLVGNVSVDKLFVAGLIPGILVIVILSAYSVYISFVNKLEMEPPSFSKIWNAVKDIIWEAPLPFLIVIGIYTGLFTVNEAAAVTAFYVLIVEVLITKDISIRDIPRIIKESMLMLGSIIAILGVALAFANYLVDQQVPMMIMNALEKYFRSKFSFLIVLNIFLLIVGCMMDIFSAIMVVVPLITPVAQHFGVDPIHLGIIFLTNLSIGYMTPPIGINLFIASFRFNKPILKLYVVSIPYLLLMLLALIIITYYPDLSLFLLKFAHVR